MATQVSRRQRFPSAVERFCFVNKGSFKGKKQLLVRINTNSGWQLGTVRQEKTGWAYAQNWNGPWGYDAESKEQAADRLYALAVQRVNRPAEQDSAPPAIDPSRQAFEARRKGEGAQSGD